MGGVEGYKVIRGSGVSMTSPEGSVLLASMFGDTFGPDDVEVFPIELPPTSVMSPHLHTADLVAWVTGGRMAFGFGDGFVDRIELEQDDMIWLGARQPHSEEVVGGHKVTMVIAHVRPFETEPA
jgi:uncharacterized RmlC-like cupin family protein